MHHTGRNVRTPSTRRRPTCGPSHSGGGTPSKGDHSRMRSAGSSISVRPKRARRPRANRCRIFCPKNDHRTVLDKDNNEHRLKFSPVSRRNRRAAGRPMRRSSASRRCRGKAGAHTSRGEGFRLRCNRTLCLRDPRRRRRWRSSRRIVLDLSVTTYFKNFALEPKGGAPLTRRDMTHRVTMKAETSAGRP